MPNILTFPLTYFRKVLAVLVLLVLAAGTGRADLPALDLQEVTNASAQAALKIRYEALQTEYAVASRAAQSKTPEGLERARRQLLLTLEDLGFRGAVIRAVSSPSKPATWQVVAGPAFLIGTIEVTPSLEGRRAPEVEPFLQTRLSDFVGMAARSDRLSDIDAALIGILGDHGYPMARIADRALQRDTDVPLAHVKIVLDPGDRGYFGKVRLKGFIGLDQSRFLAMAPFKEGDSFSNGLLDDYRSAVERTGLFKWVKTERSVEPDGFGQYQVELSAAIAQQDFKVLHNVRHEPSFWVTLAALAGLALRLVSRRAITGSKANLILSVTSAILVVVAAGFLVQRVVELVSFGAP